MVVSVYRARNFQFYVAAPTGFSRLVNNRSQPHAFRVWSEAYLRNNKMNVQTNKPNHVEAACRAILLRFAELRVQPGRNANPAAFFVVAMMSLAVTSRFKTTSTLSRARRCSSHRVTSAMPRRDATAAAILFWPPSRSSRSIKVTW